LKKFTTYDDDGRQVMAIAHLTFGSGELKNGIPYLQCTELNWVFYSLYMTCIVFLLQVYQALKMYTSGFILLMYIILYSLNVFHWCRWKVFVLEKGQNFYFISLYIWKYILQYGIKKITVLVLKYPIHIFLENFRTSIENKYTLKHTFAIEIHTCLAFPLGDLFFKWFTSNFSLTRIRFNWVFYPPWINWIGFFTLCIWHRSPNGNAKQVS
jgi:hypothetical protein